MAITILSQPATFASLHDDMWFVVESDNVVVEDFKYVYDVYVSGELVARVKNNPAPSGEGSYGIFNSAPIVRNYVENYFEPSGSNVLQATSDKLKVNYEIAFGEEVSGIITNPASGALSYSGYNFYPPLFFDGILLLGNGGDLILSDQYDNLLISNYANDWLTERDIQNVDLIFGKKFYISFFSTLYSSCSVEIQKINEDGTDNGNSASGALLSIDNFSLWDFSAARINQYVGSEFITEDVYAYKVRLVFNNIESNWITIKHVCYIRTNPVNVHFLNRLGGWDSFGFNLINKRRTQFDRRSFQRAAYQLSGSDMANTDQYNRFNEGKINFSIQHTDTYKLISDYISENDYHWLAQLVASPLVYLEVGGAYFPIVIADNNYEYKLDKSDMLFNLELNIEVSKYNNSQYR